ncbi:MAG: MaoC family dehydratase N-terminal domain-containing protein [Rhizomicrobium sp.]
MRRRIGAKITDTVEPWCYEATRDNIRHYAHGIGDDNPLWCDPEYAEQTQHSGIIAPPSFLFACNRIVSGYCGGLPGVHAMWAGAEWEWFRPIRRNDVIHSEAYLKDLIEHQTRFAGRAVQQIYHVEFSNQNGEKLAAADSWVFRTERDAARESGTKYSEVKSRGHKVYSDAELAEIYGKYENEHVQGPRPRWFEDVNVGDELPTVVKGPMTVTGFIAYAQGWGGLYIRANKLAWRLIDKHPGIGIKNKFGVPDCPERVHWENDFALEVGAPGAYDYGPERTSWMLHHLTNWCGDDGFVRASKTQIRRHNPEGDTLLISGRVTKKNIVGGESIVEVSQEARNQDGELSVVGAGRVRLPRRSA